MNPNEIIILGPTSSGKSNLANLIASSQNRAIVNCDSVQVYKDLNYLSNKQDFFEQKMENGLFVSRSQVETFSNIFDYENISFHVIRRKSGRNIVDKVLSCKDFFGWLVEMKVVENDILTKRSSVLSNYLFDIKNPGDSYSLAEFVDDVKEVKDKCENSTILVGGTVYYGYHYIFGTKFEGESFGENKGNFSDWSLEDLVVFLERNDPKSLEMIDRKNRSRVVKAVSFIDQTGKRFSESYKKESEVLDDFLLIILRPNDRRIYHNILNIAVENRMTVLAMKEILFLIEKYGDEIKPWLRQVSYEYKYCLEIFERIPTCDDFGDCEVLIEELKAKERQYAKRQMTFLRKLERELDVHSP